MKMIETILENGIGRIFLNRPEKKNALHPEMLNKIIQTLTAWEKNDRARVVLITGRGDCFCAGADLGHLLATAELDFRANLADARLLDEFFNTLQTFPKPLAAFVNGPALAGGCGIALACDIVLADAGNARFGFPEANVGFLPAIVSRFAARSAGHGRANYLLLTGYTLTAAEAYEAGIVHRFVSGGMPETEKILAKLTIPDSGTLTAIKKMSAALNGLSDTAKQDYLTALNVYGRYSGAFKNGIDTFLQRRK